MDISIIIPTFNRLWCLPRAIESCKNNSCMVEIIVVDDGSTDDTLKWLKQQEGIVVLSQHNLGKCWAVNKAFTVAKGKYIRFLDSDDQVSAGANDEQFKIAEQNKSDIVVSGYQLTDENGNLLRKQAWHECDDFIAQQLGECDSSHYSAYLFKKAFIEEIPHRPDYAFRDDRLFVLEAALKQPKVAVHKGFSLLHTRHKKARLQVNHGLQQAVQNYQHLHIYKNILGQLEKNGELTERRKKASVSSLWAICRWVGKDDINTAADIFKWILQLDPHFTVKKGKGIQGFLYKNAGVNNTHKILRLIRAFR